MITVLDGPVLPVRKDDERTLFSLDRIRSSPITIISKGSRQDSTAMIARIALQPKIRK